LSNSRATGIAADRHQDFQGMVDSRHVKPSFGWTVGHVYQHPALTCLLGDSVIHRAIIGGRKSQTRPFQITRTIWSGNPAKAFLYGPGL
jgi:hypothetical protein